MWLALGAAALMPGPIPRAHARSIRQVRPLLCSRETSENEPLPRQSEPLTTWAEELAQSEPEGVSADKPSSRADAEKMKVVDIEGDVGGFVEMFATLTQAASEAAQQQEIDVDEDPPGSQRDVIERVLDERLVPQPEEPPIPMPTPSSRRRLAELERRAEAEAEELAAAGSPFLGPLSFVGSWPIGDPRANPEVGGQRGLLSVQWARGIRDDFRRRAPLYMSDWTDGLTPKSLASICFLWFACLAPVLAFGGAMSVLTEGAMGVPEVILSRGVCGMVHALISGQPMTFLGPTGLTLAFTTALYAYCTAYAVPFLAMYAWVGVWTSGMLLLAALANLSGLIRFCTRFTEDVFNALLAFNYISEAFRSIKSGFVNAVDKGSGFLTLNTAVLTAWLCQVTTSFRTKRYLSPMAREAISDFGPPFVILAITFASLTPFAARLGTLARLPVSATAAAHASSFNLGRPLVVNLFALPIKWRLVAIIPGFFLATLFFLDQNITVRTVNSPNNKLRKGPAYHLDLLALALVNGGASLCGLPWMCSATVESLNHIRAMSIYNKKKSRTGVVVEEPERVIETRVTGFGVHAGVLLSSLALPMIAVVPLPVVSGVFLYLGRKVMAGNLFVERCKKIWLEEKEIDWRSDGAEREMVSLGRMAVFRFTAVQAACLAGLIALKFNPSTALIFPSVIGVLMLFRVKLLPRMFSRRELRLLDTAIGATPI